MRIDEAISPSVPLPVNFAGGAVLNIMYRPASASFAQMEAMVAQAAEVSAAEKAEKAAETEDGAEETPEQQLERMRKRLTDAKASMFKSVLDIVTDWDLVQNDGETPVALTEEALNAVPTNVFGEIIKAVRRHQSAAGEGKA